MLTSCHKLFAATRTVFVPNSAPQPHHNLSSPAPGTETLINSTVVGFVQPAYGKKTSVSRHCRYQLVFFRRGTSDGDAQKLQFVLNGLPYFFWNYDLINVVWISWFISSQSDCTDEHVSRSINQLLRVWTSGHLKQGDSRRDFACECF